MHFGAMNVISLQCGNLHFSDTNLVICRVVVSTTKMYL